MHATWTWLNFALSFALTLAGPAHADTSSICQLAEGNTVGTRCYCESRHEFIDPRIPSQVESCKKSNGDALVSTAQSFGKLAHMQAPGNCVDCELPKLQSCPQAIIQSSMGDGNTGLWSSIAGHLAPEHACSGKIRPQAQKLRPEQVEELISKSAQVSQGYPSPVQITATGCMDTRARRSIAGANFTEEERKKIVGEYYAAMKRLSDGELFALESIAAIDSLHEPPAGYLSGVCGDPKAKGEPKANDNPNFRLWCSKLPQCRSKSKPEYTERYRAVIALTREKYEARETARKALLALQDQQIRARASRAGVDANTSAPTETAEMTFLRAYIQAMEDAAPWIKGDLFQKAMKENKGYELAFYAQATANRKALEDQLKTIRATRACINQTTRRSCPESNQILSRLPSFKLKPDPSGALDYVNQADCRITSRAAAEPIDRLGQSLVDMAAMTVASGIIGSYAASARAAILAGEVVSSGRIAALAASAVLGSKNFTEAALRAKSVCGESIAASSTLSSTTMDSTSTLSNGVDPDQGPNCAYDSTRMSLARDRESCTTAVLTEAVPALFPMIPSALKIAKVRAIARADGNVPYQNLVAEFRRDGQSVDDLFFGLGHASKASESKIPAFLARLKLNPETRGRVLEQFKKIMAEMSCRR